MTEQRAVYVIEDEGDDTEPLAATVKITPTAKQENMANTLCDYLANDLKWIRALNEDQACILLVALVRQHPGAVQRVIDNAEANGSEESQGS